MFKIFLFLLNLYFVVCGPVINSETTCKSPCNDFDDTKINVHLVPHSHDDVGWLRTYEEYYNGTGQFDSYEHAGVKYILSSTIKALQANKNRKFIQVETAFFWRWWNDQCNSTREVVKDLVKSGQLEIINGAWSMNDEAAAHYQSIIDQFTWGFRILEDTVGECGQPKIGWQIDSFGHSREHASIMTQLGFEGLVIGRIDYRDKDNRIENKNLDFIWNTNDNFEAKIFTTMFPNFYVSESGFCFDVTCGSNDNITDDNIDNKVEMFTKILDNYKTYYQTNNILLPMGGDFTYQKAEINFQNVDKLIEGFKDHETYNVMYSTPSCYIKAVKDQVDKKKIKLTEKSDDFFPYASDSHSFWTGYFTSRPTSKRFERVGNSILQSAKQLTTFSRTKGNDDDKNILKLRMAMGVMQHHDAITGTEKQAVTDDYSLQLNEGIEEAEEPLSNIIGDLLTKEDNVTVDLKLTTCLLSNVSICETSQKSKFIVVVHNPLSKMVSHYVHLPVDENNYKITGLDDENIKYDLFDAMHSFDFDNYDQHAKKELVFKAADLPPFGIKLYYVERIDGTSSSYHKFADITTDRTFGDKTNGFTVDENGKLATITINGQTQTVTQNFFYYNGYADTSSDANHRSSGAYIFRPHNDAVPIAEKLTKQQFAKGDLVDEVLQVYDDEVTQVIRVYKDKEKSYIEFDWLVGDLQIKTEGKEVVTRFTATNFKNADIFYTDANGRQQIKRQRNKRSDYIYDPTEEPVSSNYYPVTSKIVIKDETQKLQLAVLNDRAQGGSSLAEGQIELMVHRREKADDKFGVNEVLNEIQYNKGLYARGQHYLTLGKTDGSATVFERSLAHRKLLAPVVLVGNAMGDALAFDTLKEQINFKFEGLTKSLPDNVQILTLEPWKDSYILRLEHIFEKDEDTNMSKDVTVDLTELFTLFNITELKEVTLGANQEVVASENILKRFARAIKLISDTPDLKVTLKPMEIKTFIFKTDKENEGGHDNGIIDGGNDNNSGENLRSFSTMIMFICGIYMLS